MGPAEKGGVPEPVGMGMGLEGSGKAETKIAAMRSTSSAAQQVACNTLVMTL